MCLDPFPERQLPCHAGPPLFSNPRFSAVCNLHCLSCGILGNHFPKMFS
ncbi:hypothetical protein HMPREF3231_00244 [Bifidobacterium longum]|nr:hypothetical protein HMPREF3231_00244 [Bifidobacterium longum]